MEHLTSPFWQRQPLLPLEIQRFIRKRFEKAIHNPQERQHLVWPLILGSPGVRKNFMQGIPEEELFVQAAKMLAAVEVKEPSVSWHYHQELFPDTASMQEAGWGAHDSWRSWAPMVSLRIGWQLSSLTGINPGLDYDFRCGISLFNNGLFFECHDALEPLWLSAKGEEKLNLQSLILLAAGFHHIQHQNAAGAQAVWKDALGRLKGQDRLTLSTGNLEIHESLKALDYIALELDSGDASDWGKVWKQPRPRWNLT